MIFLCALAEALTSGKYPNLARLKKANQHVLKQERAEKRTRAKTSARCFWPRQRGNSTGQSPPRAPPLSPRPPCHLRPAPGCCSAASSCRPCARERSKRASRPSSSYCRQRAEGRTVEAVRHGHRLVDACRGMLRRGGRRRRYFRREASRRGGDSCVLRGGGVVPLPVAESRLDTYLATAM